MAMFVHRHSDGKDQFDAVMSAVKASPDMIALGKDGRGEDRFTSREMIETEQRLDRAVERRSDGRGFGLPTASLQSGLHSGGSGGLVLGKEQRDGQRPEAHTSELQATTRHA